VEIFLKVRDGHIEAEDFRSKAVLGAKFLRPSNSPLPFVLRLAANRHGPIISPGLLPRKSGHRSCR